MAITPSGKGVIGFSVTGPDYYPSAGYATLDAKSGAGAIQIAAAGLGPEDGFTGYTAFGGAGEARWGDYSATAVDGQTVWVASEYIANTGTLDQYLADPTLGGAHARRTVTGTTASPRYRRPGGCGSSAISASVTSNTVNSLQSYSSSAVRAAEMSAAIHCSLVGVFS
jgi:hypothetical protein